MKLIPVLLLTVFICGCAQSSNSMTDTTSDQLLTLKERIHFVEKYVVTGRTYSELSFHITYQDNSGGVVPGPSDSDYRLVATVPADELDLWIPAGAKPTSKPDLNWLATVPDSNRAAGITEWYEKGTTVVGIDRKQNIVAYRRLKF
jgi:hypothetical protein